MQWRDHSLFSRSNSLVESQQILLCIVIVLGCDKEKNRGRNSSTIVFSCWTELVWPSAGTKNSQKNKIKMLVVKISINFSWKSDHFDKFYCHYFQLLCFELHKCGQPILYTLLCLYWLVLFHAGLLFFYKSRE